MGLQIGTATPADAAELAEVAGLTFPLACPPSILPGDVIAFIDANLSEQRFAEYLADPARQMLAVRDGRRIIGYAMLIRPDDGPDVELSKFYVLASHHGSEVAAALMQTAVDWAIDAGAQRIWLGVNSDNQRAQAFYRKQGFAVTGVRTFEVGSSTQRDFVMTRPL